MCVCVLCGAYTVHGMCVVCVLCVCVCVCFVVHIPYMACVLCVYCVCVYICILSVYLYPMCVHNINACISASFVGISLCK